ncbi:MAG: eukaryotic-like serine/threonine-protein kinase [Chthoniobacter sp.]|jgi:tetratricopeptide (TPR) repeat protein|nr:eukaryotic-like serine/threonine-protein kinase [Chthoniobacter sp.]
MRVVEDDSKAMSWITIGALLVLVVLGVVFYQHRDRIFPPREKAPVKFVRTQVSEEVETKFFEARDKIVAGKYAEASAILTAIDTEKVPQPTRNWITMQNGVAHLLAGQLPEARTEFSKVEKRGPYTQDPREEKLANFFVETARLAASEEPQKAELARNYDLATTESFALLVFGLKDSILGQYDDASTFFRQFRIARIPDSEVWLRRYQPLGESFVDSVAAYRIASSVATEAKTPERREKAFAEIRDAKAKLKGQPSLAKKLDELAAALKSQIDAANAEMSQQAAALEAVDAQVITDVKKRVESYAADYRFADASQIVFTATATGEKGKAALEAWSKRTQWLTKFKDILVADLTASGYAQPVLKKDGTPIPTGLKEADDQQVVSVTRAGKVPIPWGDIAPDSVTAMAQEFLRKPTAPEAIAERKWLLGVFLFQLGKKTEALPLLQQAAQAKPEYQAGLALFSESGAK